MFDLINLITLLFTPVMAYVAGGLIFGLYEFLRKNQHLPLSSAHHH